MRRSVLPRLIALPDGAATAAQKTAWKAHLASLPPLPQGPAAKKTFNAQKILPIAKGDGFPTTGKGQRSNSENTEMYVAHPFRLYGVGKKTDITLAQQAYAERHSPCNDGWCQVRHKPPHDGLPLKELSREALGKTLVSPFSGLSILSSSRFCSRAALRISSRRRC